MGTSNRLLVILLATIPAGAVLGSDFYLPRIGPAPLRFATISANSKGFVWPVPLNPLRSTTNSTAETSLQVSNTPTNSAVPVPSLAGSKTNNVSPPLSLEMSVSSPANASQTPNGTDGNPLSASNLLIVTPQMLADYFKATPGGLDKVSTNAPVGAEIPFNPPTPKPPSSEAVYRTQ